ncbi:MAG TPA: hypothetical protein VFR43_01525 [Gaiellaceae bacterium]|nr:hypothetical protein [Gaiellaceae bacterium]
MKSERRYALLGLVAWKLLKWQAASRVRRAGTAEGGRGRGFGRVVVALFGLVAAAGVAFWWLGRGRRAAPPLPPPPPPPPPPAAPPR